MFKTDIEEEVMGLLARYFIHVEKIDWQKLLLRHFPIAAYVPNEDEGYHAGFMLKIFGDFDLSCAELPPTYNPREIFLKAYGYFYGDLTSEQRELFTTVKEGDMQEVVRIMEGAENPETLLNCREKDNNYLLSAAYHSGSFEILSFLLSRLTDMAIFSQLVEHIRDRQDTSCLRRVIGSPPPCVAEIIQSKFYQYLATHYMQHLLDDFLFPRGYKVFSQFLIEHPQAGLVLTAVSVYANVSNKRAFESYLSNLMMENDDPVLIILLELDPIERWSLHLPSQEDLIECYAEMKAENKLRICATLSLLRAKIYTLENIERCCIARHDIENIEAIFALLVQTIIRRYEPENRSYVIAGRVCLLNQFIFNKILATDPRDIHILFRFLQCFSGATMLDAINLHLAFDLARSPNSTQIVAQLEDLYAKGQLDELTCDEVLAPYRDAPPRDESPARAFTG